MNTFFFLIITSLTFAKPDLPSPNTAFKQAVLLTERQPGVRLSSQSLIEKLKTVLVNLSPSIDHANNLHLRAKNKLCLIFDSTVATSKFWMATAIRFSLGKDV